MVIYISLSTTLMIFLCSRCRVFSRQELSQGSLQGLLTGAMAQGPRPRGTSEGGGALCPDKGTVRLGRVHNSARRLGGVLFVGAGAVSRLRRNFSSLKGAACLALCRSPPLWNLSSPSTTTAYTEPLGGARRNNVSPTQSC